VPSLAQARTKTVQQPGADAADPAGDLRLRNTLIIGTAATLYGAYGLSKWWRSGFGGGFKTTNEGWFGANRQYGGADKFGHLYSNYASVRLLTPLFESTGNSRQHATWLAAWTTLGIFTGIEVADGFSRRWRFSPHDAIANTVGAVLGAAMELRPELDEIFDFRLAYRPSGSRFDPFGDYSGQRYLLVVKADGFAPLRKGPLRYVELAVGYGTRGYDSGGQPRRDLYVGVSLNLARLLGDAAYEGRMHSTPFQRATDRVFDLVQFPTIGYARRTLD
jgi:hypothetical protein